MAIPAPVNETNPVYNNTNYTLSKSNPIWPGILANNQSNGQSKNLGPQNNTTKWVFNTSGDYGIGGQTIGSDGTIYFTSTNDENATLYALNPDGTVKWNTTLEDIENSVAPVVGDNGVLYILGNYKVPVLTAINPDGTIRWKYTFKEYESNVASYPVIGKDGSINIGLNVYDYEDENDMAKIYSINPDGTLKWTYKIHRGLEDTIYTFFNSVGQDGTLYVGSYFETENFEPQNIETFSRPTNYQGVLNAINPDGTLKWNYTFTENLYKSWGIGSASWGSSVGPDGTIYAAVTSVIDEINSVHLYAFNPNGSVKWNQTINDGYRNFVMGIPSVASNGVVYLSTLFMTSEEKYFNNLYAFSPDGKNKLWNYSYQAMSEDFSSQAIGTDGTIYLASIGSPLIALNPDGTEKWKYNYPVLGIPSINKDGTLYIGIGDYESTSSLHAIAGQQSDLYLKTLVDNKNPKVGETVKITFKVGNNGPGTAYNTTMVLKIPKGLLFIKAIAESGTFTYDASTSTITWYLGDLGVIDPYLNVWTKVLAKGTYSITPVLSTLTYDPDLVSNTESITVTAQSGSSSNVGMEHTGVPITAAIVAFLMVLGGIFTSKKRK